MTANQPTSDLLARYLQAIGDHLPAATRDDVLAELRANLQAQLDDRAEELNRPLTDAEVAAILKDHGRPIVVAARYLPQQYLIGPAIFPYYLMTLRKATPFVLIIGFLAESSRLLNVHNLSELIAGIFVSLGQLIPDLLFFAFWVTLAFAIAEYAYSQNHAKPFGLSWNPTKLPALKPQFKGKSRASRIADLIFHCLWMVYVLEIPTHPYLILGPGELYLHMLNARPAPIWHLFYAAVVFMLFFQLVTKITALVVPAGIWQTPLNFATKILGVLFNAWVALTNVYFVPAGPATNLESLAAVNYWMNIGFRIFLVFSILDLIVEAWKLRPSFQAKRLVF